MLNKIKTIFKNKTAKNNHRYFDGTKIMLDIGFLKFLHLIMDNNVTKFKNQSLYNETMQNLEITVKNADKNILYKFKDEILDTLQSSPRYCQDAKIEELIKFINNL